MAAGYSADEKAKLLSGTAKREFHRFQPRSPAESRGSRPSKADTGERQTLRWRKMDSNFRFPDASSGRSAEARTFSSDREFAPLAWRDRDFEPPAPSRVDLCVRTRTVSGTYTKANAQIGGPFRAEPKVRIHLPPAESPSLSPSCCRGSRTPAFRAAVRGWLGDRVGRDAQGVSR